MRKHFLLLLMPVLLVLPVAPAYGATGGASADSASGGPLHSGATVYGAPIRQRPVARVFRITPRSVREGTRPRIRIRVDEKGVRRVSARIAAVERGGDRVGANFVLGTIRTGRTVTLRWPGSELPPAGDWTVRLHVRDPQGATLARVRKATGKTRLLVRPRPRPESSQPEPQAQPTPSAVPGGVFPVAGPFTFGGADSVFGAARSRHTHEGHDIEAAEGTPVISPLAGTVAFVDYQRGGAGWYVVVDADDGRSMFFAHCQTNSVVVAPAQRVTPGSPLCAVGKTGSATGPHLHFELWIGGWRDRKGTPIDPLPQLRAWAGL